ncbi:MAG: cellulose biosynthesis cyclic di-GMP-binding regulatory protein BcsB [Nocardioides sp.]|nr:cellulose biosynthesis cyclic di-GMP-binding regulatory protein BcsB [Nocardioides sp.]
MDTMLSSAAAILAAACLLAAPSAPAAADELGVAQSLTTQGSQPNVTRIQVPDGVTPRALRGLLSVENAEDGQVRISIHGRVVRAVPARPSQWVSIPVSAGDLEADGSVSVGLEYVAAAAGGCNPDRSPVLAHLSRLALDFTGSESTPTTVAGFLPGTASRVDVVVPDSADDHLVEAGLTAVVALSQVYPAPVPVALSPVGEPIPRVGAGQRVVRFVQHAGGPVTSTVGVERGIPTLTITGSGTALVDAARALRSDAQAIADTRSTEGMSLHVADSDLDTRSSLSDLGAERLRLSGWGQSDAYVGIPQDEFGGPIDSLHVDLVGVHTAVAGINAQVDVFLNDALVGSTLLGDETEFHLPITVPSNLLRADNGLRIVLRALPEDGRCGPAATHPPVLLDIDGARSVITAERGAGRLKGFELYPQVFGGDVPVALRGTSTKPLGEAIAAAALLSSLQRAATHPLTVRLVSPDDLIDGDDSGLLVGASYADSAAVEAPMRLAEIQLIDLAEETFQIGTARPFAALESVSDGGRHILMLGGWDPNTETSTGKLEAKAVASVTRSGWRALRKDLLIATPDQEPFNLSTESVLPQADRVDEQRRMVWWLGGGIAAVGAVLLLQMALASRRQRAVRDLVRAQANDDGPGQRG